MEERRITEAILENYGRYLKEEERSRNTIEKYLRDIRSFQCFLTDRPVSRQVILCGASIPCFLPLTAFCATAAGRTAVSVRYGFSGRPSARRKRNCPGRNTEGWWRQPEKRRTNGWQWSCRPSARPASVSASWLLSRWKL